MGLRKRFRLYVAERCFQLFLKLTAKDRVKPQVLVYPPVVRWPAYIPSPFELEAAKIVEHYDIPVVVLPHNQACAVYGQKAGPC